MTEPELKIRARKLREEYPQLNVKGKGRLSNLGNSRNQKPLRARVKEVEKDISEGKLQKPQKGKGVGPRQKSDAPKTPNDYSEFGPRFFINTKKLKSGEFSLCHPSGQKPANIRNANLTPALRQLVQSFLAGEPVDTSDLNADELRWYKSIWEECKLKRPVKLPELPAKKQQFTKKWAQSRWKVLVGEVEAGNDSPELIKELEDLVDGIEIRNYLDRSEINKLRKFIELSQ